MTTYERPFKPDITNVHFPGPLTKEGSEMLTAIMMLDQLPGAAMAWREAEPDARARIEAHYPAVIEHVSLEDLMAQNASRVRRGAQLILREDIETMYGPLIA